MTAIGRVAFQNCTGLTSVTIPNEVTSIGDQTFMGCSGLTAITIGNSIDTIRGSVFTGCGNIDTLYFLNNMPPVIDSTIFSSYHHDEYDDIHLDGVSRNAVVVEPCESLSAYQNAPYYDYFANRH